MACHCLHLRNQREFLTLMKERNTDIIIKMVKCVLSASKRNRDKIDIFDITFKDMSSMLFSIDKDQYNELLKNCLDDLIKVEEYELCADIQKQLDKKKRGRKPKQVL